MHFMILDYALQWLSIKVDCLQGWTIPLRGSAAKQLPIHNAHPGKIKETGWQIYRTNGAIEVKDATGWLFNLLIWHIFNVLPIEWKWVQHKRI